MSLVVFTGLVGLMLAPGSLHPVLAFTAILCMAVDAAALLGAGALSLERLRACRRADDAGGRRSARDQEADRALHGTAGAAHRGALRARRGRHGLSRRGVGARRRTGGGVAAGLARRRRACRQADVRLLDPLSVPAVRGDARRQD